MDQRKIQYITLFLTHDCNQYAVQLCTPIRLPRSAPKYDHMTKPLLSDNSFTLANLYALLWWIRHTEAGYYALCGGYAIRRRGIMLAWWGIMLDVVDTPYRGGVLC